MNNINGNITANRVNLISDSGERLGIVDIQSALQEAKKRNMDLVEMTRDVEVPTCKIMDFNKYRYELKKKASESRKKQKGTVIKEIILRPNIAINDLNTKINHIKNFISRDNIVKLYIKFKGREIAHTEVGAKVFERVLLELKEAIKVDSPPKMQGNRLMMTISSSK